MTTGTGTITNGGTTTIYNSKNDFRFKIDIEFDYAILWAFMQSRADGRPRYIYESVKGVAVSMDRVAEGKNFFTDGETIGIWPANWDEGFRDRDIETRVLAGPPLQFGN